VNRRLSAAVPLVALLLGLGLPAGAAQTLDSTPTCQGLSVDGTRFPERVVLLMVRDVRSGKVLAGPVQTVADRDGSFRAELRVDLTGRRMVEVTAWKKAGTTVVLTARELVRRPCVAAPARRGGPAVLPATGGPRPAMLMVGLSLLALGALIRHAVRYRGRHGAAAAVPFGRDAKARIPWRRHL
jgi:hypothetical protein